ncbi:TPA: threonine--tRNA ligase [Patescibacteria group bacterium]|nr:threonine--tRNA ligase [Patescibacteria group bacterium]
MTKTTRTKKADKRTDLSRIRHSASHILAEAVLNLYPGVKLGFGPATEDGFYYDFEFKKPITDADLPKVESEMIRLIAEGRTFKRSTKTTAAAKLWAKKVGQPYKTEQIEELKKTGYKTVSFYASLPASHAELGSASSQTLKRVQGDGGREVLGDGKKEFIDLCEGPHVASTKEIGALKLLSVAGAYWRGSEKNIQLTRIYGTAFAATKELDLDVGMLEEAKKRDHRKLGAELGLFTFDNKVGSGLPLWLPNGTIIIEELERLAKQTELAAGYKQVRTPHIAKQEMYLTSGHLPYYEESMFPPMELEGDKYYLKAMNCPHHHTIFAGNPKSYRDLPLRLAEYGTCYRYEKSGELFGLMRARMLSMNDAHIYCAPEQFAAEFQAVNEMYLKYFKLFGIKQYVMRFSTHAKEGLGKKYVNEPKLWKATENMVRAVLKKSKIPFVEIADEAAFYGPKIDVQVTSSIGREFTLATNQVECAQPRRFNLTYTDAKGKPQIPLCIHRAPLGTHERFIGFLIEHYAGIFPLWLAPVQVRVLPISDKHLAYARTVAESLITAGVRAEVNDRSESLGKQIREAELNKVPYMLVIGDKEKSAKTVAIRHLTRGDLGTKSVGQLIKLLRSEITTRK